MSFDASLPTLKDHLRLALYDIDPANEFQPDTTYEAKLALYGAVEVESLAYKRAKADMIEPVANAMDRQPSGINQQGVGGINWPEQAKTLRAMLDGLRKEIAAVDAAVSQAGVGQMIGVRARYLAGGRTW